MVPFVSTEPVLSKRSINISYCEEANDDGHGGTVFPRFLRFPPSVSLRLISHEDTRQNGLGWTLMTS